MPFDVGQLSSAERLLWSYGVTAPRHIDLEAIAADRGAEVRYRRLDGCEARLVASSERAVISINSSSSLGRQRFSLGHELAHWIVDRDRGAFLCASDDIGPQNDESRSVEANANAYASQLILPDYLVRPWVEGKRATLDTARQLADEFTSSLTAAAIKLAKRAGASACVACHSQTKLVWFQKAIEFPDELRIVRELHADTDAFNLAFGGAGGMSRAKREPAQRWITGPNAYRLTVESQSVRLPDSTVLTTLSLQTR